ncbi:hypothetical protein CR513_58674, partial [Mucuna pruriens]
MPSIDLDFLCHRLSISLGPHSVSQEKRRLGEEKKIAVKAKIAKLLWARFIREVKYPSWLSNVVMVKKPSGRWRMCTDYMNLNKACPKDPYPLPNIDTLVDGASSCGLLSFMDTYSSYIKLGCIQIYVDDMVVKFETETGHAENLALVFRVLRRYKLKLNLEKCSFGSTPIFQGLRKAQRFRWIYERACGSHIGGRALASKIIRAGFDWPTIKKDSLTFVKKFDKCQCYADRHLAPPESLHSVISPWPFYMWGMDILGIFPLAVDKVKFLLVAIDYFTKWIEIELVAMIPTKRVRRFYWRRIICRFGLSTIIVSDNDT